MLVMGMQLTKRDLRDFTRRDYDDALTVFHNEQLVDVMFGSGGIAHRMTGPDVMVVLGNLVQFLVA
jgi:hypothetical protein